MGYRDDFYTAANMIGYSGDLHSFPTVYFQSGQEFGHITQKHDTSQNVGRGTVCAAENYSIGNEMVEGAMKLVEKIGTKAFHVSRSTLTPVAQMSNDDQSIISQAIWNCTDEKYIDGYTDEIFDALDATDANKARMHKELLKRK